MRTYRCLDCPPNAGAYEASARGPLPDRCPAHRVVRNRVRMRVKRSGLSLVPEGAAVEPEALPPVADVTELPERVPSISEVVRADLDALMTSHPARDSLTALAVHLASLVDSPAAAADLRALTGLHREIRETIRDLVKHEEAGDDDLFGDDDVPTHVVDAKTG